MKASAANLLVNGGFESPIPSSLTSGYAFADGDSISQTLSTTPGGTRHKCGRLA